MIRRVSFLGGLTNIGGPVTSYPCGKMSPRSGPESTMCNESNTLQGKIDLSESVAESRVETELPPSNTKTFSATSLAEKVGVPGGISTDLCVS